MTISLRTHATAATEKGDGLRRVCGASTNLSAGASSRIKVPSVRRAPAWVANRRSDRPVSPTKPLLPRRVKGQGQRPALGIFGISRLGASGAGKKGTGF